MRLGIESLLLDPRQQRLCRGLVTEVDADGQSVDEQAHQPFDFAASTVGYWRTDDHIILASQASQQAGPRGHDRHEQGAAAALAQCLETSGKVFVEHDGQCCTGIVLQRRTRTVGGQHQQRRSICQGLLPEIALLLQHIATQPATLPHGVVQVLQLQRRQRVVLVLTECGIERGQFVGQHINRPAIGNDMVQGQQQYVMVLGHTNQAATNQRALFQIEALQRLFAGQCLKFFLGIRQPLQIVHLQVETGVRRADALHRLSVIALHERGA